MILSNLSDPAKHAVDAVAGVTLLATLISALPPIAAALSVVWVVLRIRVTLLEHRIRQQEFKLNQRRLDQ